MSVASSPSSSDTPQAEESSKAAATKAPQLSLGTRVFQNTAAQLIGRVFSIGFSGVTSILLARYLGKELLGQYGAIYAYLALYAFLATFCLEQILAREVSVRPARGAEIFRTGTLAALGFSVAGLVIAPLAAPLFGYSGSLRWLIAVAAIDLLILPPLRLSGIIFQVEMRLWYNVVIGLIRQAMWLVAVVLLALRNAAFYEVIVARLLVGILEALIVVWTVKRVGLVQGKAQFVANEARMMIKEGLPLVLMTMAVSVYHRIDQVMLHKMSGDVVLGPYVIAVQLTELFSALPVALMGSLFPALAQSAHDEEKFARYLRETFRFLMVVVFAACALVTPIAYPLVDLFYGKQFLSTAGLLIILIWSEIPVFFGVVLSNALVANRLQKYTAYGAVFGAVVNVLLNLALIPRYGAMGASWATVISYAAASILIPLLLKPVRPTVWIGLKVAVRPFLLAVGTIAITNLIPLGFWWKSVFSVFLFVCGGLMISALTREDFERLLTMFRLRKRN